MYPTISNKRYWLDRIRHERRCGLGFAVIMLAVAMATGTQAQPQREPMFLIEVNQSQQQFLLMALDSHVKAQGLPAAEASAFMKRVVENARPAPPPAPPKAPEPAEAPKEPPKK